MGRPGTASDASRDGMYVEDAAVIDVDVRESETQDAQPGNELTDAGDPKTSQMLRSLKSVQPLLMDRLWMVRRVHYVNPDERN